MTEIYERTFAQFTGLTTSAPAGAVFQDEILGSSITTALEGLSVRAAAAKVYVHFADVLSGPELTTFDGLVTAHDGVPYTEQTRTAPVLDRHLSTPPGTPAKWARYIVGPSPTGDWADWEDYVVEWDTVSWTPARPMVGTMVYVQDEAIDLQWNGATWVAPAGGGDGLPAQWHYGESSAQSSTTSSSWRQRLKLTTGVLPAGNYLVRWTFEWKLSSTSRQFEARVQVDDTETIGEVIVRPRAETLWEMQSGFAQVTLTNAVHEIDIDYRRSSSPATAYVRRARLSIQQVA
jgi:hypothetical protein